MQIVQPLVARLAMRIAALDVVLADETSMRLQDRVKRGFVWVFHGHDATEQKIVRSPAHLALRTERSKPLVDEFFAWAEAKKPELLPKSPLGEALGYAINQRPRLELFLTDPRIPLHNNASEARLRVIALARHNYLFFGHPRAGRNFAGLYSLVGSCTANGIEPTEYLTDVLARVRDATTEKELDALLPDRWQPLGPAPPDHGSS